MACDWLAYAEEERNDTESELDLTMKIDNHICDTYSLHLEEKA